jgi:hypothetical protein
MLKRLHVKYPLFLSGFNETSTSSAYFRKKKKTQISSFIKICPMEAEFFHADGQTGMKLIVAFHNFAKVPKTTAVYFVAEFTVC